MVLPNVNAKISFAYWGFVFTTHRPTWACPHELMDIWNCQILMHILTLHAAVGLQSEFDANQIKNIVFDLGIRRSSWPYLRGQWIFEITKYWCRFLLSMLRLVYKPNLKKIRSKCHFWARDPLTHLDPPGPTWRPDGYLKSSNTEADF